MFTRIINTYRNFKTQRLHYKRVKYQNKINKMLIEIGCEDCVRFIF